MILTWVHTEFKTNRRAIGSKISKILVLVTDEYIKKQNKHNFYKLLLRSSQYEF